MNEQHREVQSWLEGIFGSDPVPQYEISGRSLWLLNELRGRSQREERHADTIIADLQQKAFEYSAEADRISATLSPLGLGVDSLSQSGAVSVRTLASVAALLEVRNASDTSLLLAMSELSQKGLSLTEHRRHEQQLTASLFSKTKAALLKCNNLNKVLGSLEEQAEYAGPELSKKAKQAGFLQSKARDYSRQISQLKAELSKSGMEPGVYHQRLVNKSQEMQALRDKLNPLKAKLDSYQKLPPDLSLAKVKLEEARRELASIEKELGTHIDLMHM